MTRAVRMQNHQSSKTKVRKLKSTAASNLTQRRKVQKCNRKVKFSVKSALFVAYENVYCYSVTNTKESTQSSSVKPCKLLLNSWETSSAARGSSTPRSNNVGKSKLFSQTASERILEQDLNGWLEERALHQWMFASLRWSEITILTNECILSVRFPYFYLDSFAKIKFVVKQGQRSVVILFRQCNVCPHDKDSAFYFNEAFDTLISLG